MSSSSQQDPRVLTINDKKYDINTLSDQAKEAVSRVQVADAQIQLTRDRLKLLTVVKSDLTAARAEAQKQLKKSSVEIDQMTPTVGPNRTIKGAKRILQLIQKILKLKF